MGHYAGEIGSSREEQVESERIRLARIRADNEVGVRELADVLSQIPIDPSLQPGDKVKIHP